MAESRNMDCPECGRRIQADASLCNHCGVRFRTDAQTGDIIDQKKGDEATDWMATILSDVEEAIAEAENKEESPISSVTPVGGPGAVPPGKDPGVQDEDEEDRGLPEGLADRIWWYKKVAEEDPTDVSAYLMVAQAYEEANRPVKALGFYREALKLDRTNAQAKAKVSALMKLTPGTTPSPAMTPAGSRIFATPAPGTAPMKPTAAEAPKRKHETQVIPKVEGRAGAGAREAGAPTAPGTRRPTDKVGPIPSATPAPPPAPGPSGRAASWRVPTPPPPDPARASGSAARQPPLQPPTKATEDTAAIGQRPAPSAPPRPLAPLRAMPGQAAPGTAAPVVEGEREGIAPPAVGGGKHRLPLIAGIAGILVIVVVAGGLVLTKQRGKGKAVAPVVAAPTHAPSPAPSVEPSPVAAAVKPPDVKPLETKPSAAPAEGGAAKPFQWTDSTDYPVAVSWSPDGGRIAMEFYKTALERLHPTADERWKTSVILSESLASAEIGRFDRVHLGPSADPVAWDPEGKSVFFDSVDSDGSAIFRYTLATKALDRVTLGRQPSVSPDGKRLAFVASPVEGEPGGAGPATDRVFVMELEGGGGKRVPISKEGGGSPVWSPEGARIAYAVEVFQDEKPASKDKSGKDVPRAARRWAGRDLVVAKADGSGQAARLASGGINEAPRWAGDGKRVSYVHYDLGPKDRPETAPVLELADRIEKGELWIVSADGKDARRVLGFAEGAVDVRRACWRSGGKEIVYQGAIADRSVIVSQPGPQAPKQANLGGNIDVFTFKVDGGEKPRRLQDEHASKMNPVPGPDGSRIAFVVTNDDLLDQVWISSLK